MASRDRVLKALSYEDPERIPIDLGGSLTNAGIAKKLEISYRKGQARESCGIYRRGKGGDFA